MSTVLEETLQSFWLNNCAAIVLVTAIIYDYFLTISSEIDYIWLKHWTHVTSLFLVIRYLGLCVVFLYGYMSSSLFSGSVISNRCTVFYLVLQWTLLLYNAVVDLVMILRIYAMWDRSRSILTLLLCVFVPETIIAFVFAAVYSNPNTYMSVTTNQILDITLCDISYNLPSPFWTYLTPTFFFAALLLILPLIQTLRHSLDMYKATKKWQPNKYMKQLLMDGILYFFIRSIYDIRTALAYGTDAVSYKLTLVLNTGTFLLLFSSLPRFIIIIRELHDRDTHRQWWDIDTGFGVVSSPTVTAEEARESEIVFEHTFPARYRSWSTERYPNDVELKPF